MHESENTCNYELEHAQWRTVYCAAPEEVELDFAANRTPGVPTGPGPFDTSTARGYDVSRSKIAFDTMERAQCTPAPSAYPAPC